MSRYSNEMHTPPCSGCSLGSGHGLLYIAMRAMTERRLLKLDGVGSLRGSVAIIIVRIDSKDLRWLADRRAMRWRGKSGDRRCKKAQVSFTGITQHFGTELHSTSDPKLLRNI